MRATERLLQQVGPETGRVVLSCAVQPPRVRRDALLVHGDLGCLAELPDHLVPELLAAGVGVVQVDASCPHDAVGLGDWVERQQRLCGQGRVFRWNGEEGRVLVPARPADLGDRAASRRAVLGRVESSDSSGRRSGEARLRAALRQLPTQPGQDLSSEPSTAVQLRASGCTACGVCVQACPHDALELVDVEVDGQRRSGLVHRPSPCEGDGECIALCPEQALSRGGLWSLARTLEGTGELLAARATAICERCHGRHPAEEGPLCPTCRHVRERPFGQAMSVAEILALQRR